MKYFPRLSFGAFLLVLATASHALESDRRQPADIGADRYDTDLKTGLTVFEGNVVLTQGTLELKADRAEITQKEQRIARALISGSPATLKQMLDDGPIDARATQIEYQLDSGQVVLTGAVEIRSPRGTLSGERVEYDLKTGRIQGSSTPGERVRLRVEPEAEPTPEPSGS